MLLRRLACEFIGTAFLLATVVGSGALIHKIDGGTIGITVIAVAVATGFVLYALINMFGEISAHFNPVVSLVNALTKTMSWSHVPLYMLAQVLGAIAGVMAANVMFELPAVVFSTTARTGYGQCTGELIATFGLICTISCCARFRPAALPAAVSAYVAGAILFTSSTCFANPAVTVARIFTDTITGIRAIDVAPYITCQIAAALTALSFCHWLLKPVSSANIAETEQDGVWQSRDEVVADLVRLK